MTGKSPKKCGIRAREGDPELTKLVFGVASLATSPMPLPLGGPAAQHNHPSEGKYPEAWRHHRNNHRPGT
jgi:hypothetical protein